MFIFRMVILISPLFNTFVIIIITVNLQLFYFNLKRNPLIHSNVMYERTYELYLNVLNYKSVFICNKKWFG